MSGFTGSAPTIPYASGRYYAFEGMYVVSPGSAAAAGTLRFAPLVVRAPVTIASLIITVTTAAASGNFQLMIYASDPVTGWPTGTPLYRSASQSTATATSVEITGVNFAMLPGKVYWVAVQVDTNGATAAFGTPSSNDSGVSRISGLTSGANIAHTSQITTFLKTGTFNTPPTLTGNFVTDGHTTSNGSGPYVAFKSA